MDEKMLEDLKDLRFVMTNEMKELLVRLLVIKQTLDEDDKLSHKNKKVLQKEFNNLLESFRSDFQANNKVQVQIVRAYLSSK